MKQIMVYEIDLFLFGVKVLSNISLLLFVVLFYINIYIYPLILTLC